MNDKIYYVKCEEIILGLPYIKRQFIYYFKSKEDAKKWTKKIEDGFLPEKYVVKTGEAWFDSDDGVLCPMSM